MLSNLASYFFGSEEVPESQAVSNVDAAPPADTPPLNGNLAVSPIPSDRPATKDDSDSEEDWVLLGGVRIPKLRPCPEPEPKLSRAPSPVQCGCLFPSGIGSSSVTSEERKTASPPPPPRNTNSIGNDPPRRQDMSRTQRRLTAPFSCQSAVVALSQLKATQTAQSSQQKKAAKSLTAKAVERKNKAVKNMKQGSGSKKAGLSRHNLAIKASGCNKNLKLC